MILFLTVITCFTFSRARVIPTMTVITTSWAFLLAAFVTASAFIVTPFTVTLFSVTVWILSATVSLFSWVIPLTP